MEDLKPVYIVSLGPGEAGTVCVPLSSVRNKRFFGC